jgi:hypothetical protein
MRERRPSQFEADATHFIISSDSGKEETEVSAESGGERAEEKEEEGTAVLAPESEERRESLAEVSELLRNVDRLTVELYDARIAEAESPEEIREIVKDLNTLLELRESEICKPPCEHLEDMKDKGKKGANQSYLLRLIERGRELAGVYKPTKGEQRMARKAGIKDGTQAQRELLTFLVDRALELGVVPPTVLRDEDKGIGSVQAFVENADSAAKVRDRTGDPEGLVKIALLHFITGQQDGHRGNVLIDRTPEKRRWAIDGALSFGAAVHDEKGQEVTPALEVNSKILKDVGDISEAVQAPILEIHLKKFLGSPRRQESLKKAFEFTLGDEAEEDWNAFMGKIKDLSGKNELPRDYDIEKAKKNIVAGWMQEHPGLKVKKIAAAA